ncbi:hypothetical protein SUGI_0563160 [Cryptomeria japonica]|nr:hypothetical protein SUGI_0563160 [Cryptomeria japonica]
MSQNRRHSEYTVDLRRILPVEMGSIMLQIRAFMALALLLPYARATTYTVGDTSQWNLGVDYSTWATGKTFAVGDQLTFVYSSLHSVVEVSKSAYDSCSTSNPLKVESGSPTSVTMDKTGGRWFICGTPGHCSGGMKLAITVSPATVTPSTPTSPSSPAATTSPSPPSATKTSPSTPQIDCNPPPSGYNYPYYYINRADPLLFHNKFTQLFLIGLLLYIFI